MARSIAETEFGSNGWIVSKPRFGGVDGRELLERGLLAVVVDLDAVEQSGRRPARAQGGELRLSASTDLSIRRVAS
jgi:hypothetical protein